MLQLDIVPAIAAVVKVTEEKDRLSAKTCLRRPPVGDGVLDVPHTKLQQTLVGADDSVRPVDWPQQLRYVKKDRPPAVFLYALWFSG